MDKIKELARQVLNSEYNNGFGVKCDYVSKICKENNVDFKTLWIEIVKQGNQDINQ